MTEPNHQRDTMLANFALSGGTDVAAAFGELLAERDGWRKENDRHRALYVEAVKGRDLLRSALLDILVVEHIGSAHDLAHGALDGVASELDEIDERPPVQRILVDYARDLQAERDRLRAVVEAARVYRDIMLREEVKEGGAWLQRADNAGSALFAALDQLDVGGDMGDEPVVLADGTPVPEPYAEDVRQVKVTIDLWHLINQEADRLTGVDANVIRGWLDCTIRPLLLGPEEGEG